MDNNKNLVRKHTKNIKYIFILGAIISGINTLARADYNFVLYLYLLYAWAFMENEKIQNQDKVHLFYLLFYSCLIDLFWCLFWGGKWEDVTTLVHEITIIFSWIGLLVKIFAILFIGLLEYKQIREHFFSLIKKKGKGDYNLDQDL